MRVLECKEELKRLKKNTGVTATIKELIPDASCFVRLEDYRKLMEQIANLITFAEGKISFQWS